MKAKECPAIGSLCRVVSVVMATSRLLDSSWLQEVEALKQDDRSCGMFEVIS